ncbi:MAG: DUF58 domain-containing protein [Planctomycetota bacterium]|jgi:uncharacterized protein (DUF58 family)|nr:DUF58 domain-containing protein [Planctomycetota bacterium]
MMAPTGRAAALFSLSLPAALLIVFAWGWPWEYSFLFPFAALAAILSDAALAAPNRRLAAELEFPPRLAVGCPGQAVVRLACGRPFRDFSVQALLEQTGEAEEPETASGEVRNGNGEIRLPVMPLRRGRIGLEALWLRWRGPWGLVELRRRQAVGKRIEVVHDLRGIHEAALRFFAADAPQGVKSQRLRGEGAEFDKLCDYAAGMDSRFIDWKRSARHRKLLCKEFRQERNHQIVLGFDTGRLMLEPIDGLTRLDHAVRAGLLLGWISLREGDLVGGCGFASRLDEFLPPGRGMSHFSRLQSFAAGLAYRTEETNFTLGLAEFSLRLRRRALVILFTDFVDAVSAELMLESLNLAARKHVVLFVTFRDPLLARLRDAPPDSFRSAAEAVLADEFLRDRSIVLERMARLGVHCLEVSAGELSGALLNRYLLIRQRGLL